MYLKRIEAIGFKSFADKTVIEFQKGITAIVGPNGSGKSNISDAIKWVLGEQSSKSLRGDTMIDVIFNGTTERPPLNVAEVTLVLDNSDKALPVEYEEVSLTRRLFRSGDSNYFINKQKVRLKDIRDIILDSGVGSDSLAIISQDKVREVIEANNEERRAVIEEAAGVLKYKNRKKETIRNLEHTEGNLERASDILSELESQYEHLEKQSKVAKEYLEIKGQLENIEIALYARDIETAVKRIREIDKLIQEQTIQTLNYETMQTKNGDKIDALNNEKIKLETKIAENQNELIDVTSKISYIEGQRRALMGKGNNENFDDLFKENLEELMKQDNILKALNKKIDNDYELLGKNRRELTKYQNQYNENINEKHSLRTRIEVLNDFSNSYYGGVKNVLNAKELKGIHGTVDSLINTEEQYITAIETALAAATQHLIVESVDDAKAAIAYLKRGNLGRATFLPMDSMKGRTIEDGVLRILRTKKGFIDAAVNLVNFDRKYRNIMDNLLGNVVICDNLDNATLLSKAINNAYRIITLDGDVIHVGGSMTGGKQEKRSPSLLQQRLSLDEANAALERNDKEGAALKLKIQGAETAVKDVEDTLHAEQIESTRLEENLRSRHEIIEQMKLSMNQDDMKALYEKRNALLGVIQGLRKKSTELTESIQHLERENLEMTRMNRNITNEMHENDIEKNRTDVRYNNMIDFLTNEYHMTYDYAREHYNLEMDYEVAKIRVRNLRRHLEGLGNVNVDSIAEFNEVKTRYEALKQNYDDLINAKENILSSIKELDVVMIERFKDAFAKINVEFNKVFRQMFNGGNAELILEDETDLLNTGIEIIAQPPGTKLSNSNLLSGGQKTLTSISLLFAILRVRTVPFCVLDECEAALDEANVMRYGEYLHRFNDQSQFIVITHRKGTMEKADVLYGVTMQESGVTTIVSVRLEETDQYIEKEITA